MTRRLLTLFSIAAAVLLSASLVTAPVNGEGPAVAPARFEPPASGGESLNLRLGDGIVRLRIRSTSSQSSVTVELRLPRFLHDIFCC